MDEQTAASGDPAGEARHPGVIRGLVSSTLDALKTRLDLVAVEAEIYLLRMVHMLVWAIAALVCALLALAFGIVTLIMALWNTHRTAGLLGGTIVFVVLAAICGIAGARVFRNRPGLLEGTLQQLEHDHRRMGGSQ